MEKVLNKRKLPDISDLHKIKSNDEPVKFRFKKKLIGYVRQYTDSTGIHGFNYMGQEGRSIMERIFWAISFGICLYICTVLIKDTWKKWDSTPVLVSFSKTPISIWNVPFPAMTICPYTKSKQGMYNYTESFNNLMEYGNFTENEMKNFSASSLVCNNYLFSGGSKTIGLEAIDHIINVAPQLKGVFFDCRWDLHFDNCSTTFGKVLTEDGLCYTSNMLGKQDIFRDNVYLHYDMADNKSSEGWSLEDGYADTANKDSFPRRAKFSGFPGSQVLLLADYEQDLDYSCKGPVQGYKIILHHPAEMPRADMNYLQSPLESELLIIVTPDMMTTSRGIQNYDPHKRECFFPNERYLSFFKIYTQQSCEFECLTNFTLAKCGCAAFYMPFEKSTPVCGPGSLKCIFEAKSELFSRTTGNGNSELDSNKRGFPCDCLPACSSLAYNAEFSQSYFNWKKVFEGYRENLDELPGLHLTRLTMFFKESQFIPAERNEMFGLTDFLANCGGILGLFTGFSFISIVEIIYFLSLRFLCNIKMYGRQYWSGITSE